MKKAIIGNNMANPPKVYVNYQGENIPLVELIRKKGLYKSCSAIRKRIHAGMPLEEALTKPINKNRPKKTCKYDEKISRLAYLGFSIKQISEKVNASKVAVKTRLKRILINRVMCKNDIYRIGKEKEPLSDNEWDYGMKYKHLTYPKYNYNEVKHEGNN